MTFFWTERVRIVTTLAHLSCLGASHILPHLTLDKCGKLKKLTKKFEVTLYYAKENFAVLFVPMTYEAQRILPNVSCPINTSALSYYKMYYKHIKDK
jgi:hypothetical protein